MNKFKLIFIYGFISLYIKINNLNEQIKNLNTSVILSEKIVNNNINNQQEKIIGILLKEKTISSNVKELKLLLNNNIKIFKDYDLSIFTFMNKHKNTMELMVGNLKKLIIEYQKIFKKNILTNKITIPSYKTTNLYSFFGVKNGNVILVSKEGKYIIAKIDKKLEDIGIVSTISNNYVIAGEYIIKQ